MNATAKLTKHQASVVAAIRAAKGNWFAFQDELTARGVPGRSGGEKIMASLFERGVICSKASKFNLGGVLTILVSEDAQPGTEVA